MRKLLALLLIAIGACALSSCATTSTPRSAQTQTTAESTAASATEFAYEGEDGRTALELLEKNADQVGVVGEGANAFVTSINGVEAQDSKNEFWALYVDGVAATTGAGSLMTANGETIEWSLETFS